MAQNTSHAVMAQRTESLDSLDDFPTPPWATRALLEHVVGDLSVIKTESCLEPACGRGHMSKVLKEYFGLVQSSDIFDYGYGEMVDFGSATIPNNSFDWVITNPPFKSGEDFVTKSLAIAKKGVAMLVRTVFIESVGRYERLFSSVPPYAFAQVVERVPMVKGRLDKKASTATGYGWLVWRRDCSDATRLLWIPPCRKKLERLHDYEIPPSARSQGISVDNGIKLDGIVAQCDMFEKRSNDKKVA
jgi:hypothetical protein